MSNHTPGPWTTDGKARNVSDTLFAWVKMGDVGNIHVRGETVEQCEANARLIAAAPDLLEALEGYAECSDGCTCGDGWSHEPARAVIAKA